MATEVIMVVGKSPLDDKYGFDAVSDMTFGSFIPDKIEGVLVSSFKADASDGSVVLTLDGTTNVLGTTATAILESGQAIDLTGVAGVYTAGVPSTTFAGVILSHLNGVQNMLIGLISAFVSGATTSTTTIDITLDAAPDTTSASEWTVTIGGVTDNVVTDAVINGSVVTLTVTTAITVGQVITVSHTRTSAITEFTAQPVTNNVA